MSAENIEKAAGLPKDGMLILQSEFVVRARLHVPLEAIKKQAASKQYDYVAIQADIEKTYKGQALAPSIDIRYFGGESYDPSPQTVLDLDGKEALVFLLRIDEGPAGYYFAGYTPDALRPFDPSNAQAVNSEIERQKRLLSAYPGSMAGKPDGFDGQVHDLVLTALQKGRTAEAFDRLEKLGCGAVPAMIRQMDDNRPFPDDSLRFMNNWPGAFEAWRFYSPKVLTDAFSGLLNQITGESFFSIENGGSERSRRDEADAWRIYAMCVDVVAECRKEDPSKR